MKKKTFIHGIWKFFISCFRSVARANILCNEEFFELYIVCTAFSWNGFLPKVNGKWFWWCVRYREFTKHQAYCLTITHTNTHARTHIGKNNEKLKKWIWMGTSHWERKIQEKKRIVVSSKRRAKIADNVCQLACTKYRTCVPVQYFTSVSCSVLFAVLLCFFFLSLLRLCYHCVFIFFGTFNGS